jgi:hypothetical protein
MRGPCYFKLARHRAAREHGMPEPIPGNRVITDIYKIQPQMHWADNPAPANSRIDSASGLPGRVQSVPEAARTIGRGQTAARGPPGRRLV